MASYNSINNQHQSPYGSGDPYYSESTGYITPMPSPKKGGISKWIKFGIPALVVVIVGAVVGGVFGSRSSNDNSSASSSDSSSSSSNSGSGGGKSAQELGRFATTTNAEWQLPVYPSTVRDSATHAYVRKFLPATPRPTQRYSRLPQSSLMSRPGPMIPSSRRALVSRPSVRTVRASLPPNTSGMLSQTLSPAILTLRGGTTPFSKTPHNTIRFPL